MIVITFGTYDLFHVGHLRLLRRARALGDKLVVGLSTDELNVAKKGRAPVVSYEHRKEILEAFDFVDRVFPEESLDMKSTYVERCGANVLAMGDDWAGRFDDVCDRVVYLERTSDVSTTDYIADICARATPGE